MDEVTGILIATVALFGGLLLMSWAYGDFNRPKAMPRPDDKQPAPPS